jgi:hypothetical protein
MNSNSIGSKKGQKAKITIVESEVRRSTRLKEQNKGSNHLSVPVRNAWLATQNPAHLISR